MNKPRPGSAGVSPAKTHSKDTSKGWYSRNYLPHFDTPGAIQAITHRLADALPKAVLQRLAAIQDDTEKRKNLEAWMDAGLGSCFLADSRCANIVEQALFHHDGDKYRLLAWCVMPNHVHVLIQVASGASLPKIVHAWKSWTAKQINRVLGRSGTLWQREYHNRYIRDDNHLAAVIRYIHTNPVKAGLVSRPGQWRFSSARFAGKMPALPAEQSGKKP